MIETLKTQLMQYIERLDDDQIEENQLHIAIGFFRTLFGFND